MEVYLTTSSPTPCLFPQLSDMPLEVRASPHPPASASDATDSKDASAAQDESASASAAGAAISAADANAATGGKFFFPTELRLHPGLCLPAELCEKMLDAMQREGFDFADENAGVFADACRSRLRTVSLRGCSITDMGMEHLLK